MKKTLIAVAMLFISGCSIRSGNMVCQKLDATTRHPYSIEVSVDADFKLNPLWKSELTEAIEKSILHTELFQSITTSKNADYKLKMTIIEIKEPYIGADYTAHMKAKWALMQDDTIIWSDIITASHTTKVGEALFGEERAQKACEGVVRANVKEGLSRLAQLDLELRSK